MANTPVRSTQRIKESPGLRLSPLPVQKTTSSGSVDSAGDHQACHASHPP